jgi:hypothetical protein
VVELENVSGVVLGVVEKIVMEQLVKCVMEQEDVMNQHLQDIVVVGPVKLLPK